MPIQIPTFMPFLTRENINIDSHTTWWEVVDALYERGFVHEAIQAQRYAVPVLEDIAAQITQNAELSRAMTMNCVMTQKQGLLDSINAYPILKQPTQFDLGDAQIVSLDLDEVAPRGGTIADRQSAVMYMLARHILGSRFSLCLTMCSSCLNFIRIITQNALKPSGKIPKRICYDEAHRVTGNTSRCRAITG